MSGGNVLRLATRLSLFKALVTVGLSVHRDVEGTAGCGTADLDERELGD